MEFNFKIIDWLSRAISTIIVFSCDLYWWQIILRKRLFNVDFSQTGEECSSDRRRLFFLHFGSLGTVHVVFRRPKCFSKYLNLFVLHSWEKKMFLKILLASKTVPCINCTSCFGFELEVMLNFINVLLMQNYHSEHSCCFKH